MNGSMSHSLFLPQPEHPSQHLSLWSCASATVCWFKPAPFQLPMHISSRPRLHQRASFLIPCWSITNKSALTTLSIFIQRQLCIYPTDIDACKQSGKTHIDHLHCLPFNCWVSRLTATADIRWSEYQHKYLTIFVFPWDASRKHLCPLEPLMYYRTPQRSGYDHWQVTTDPTQLMPSDL